MLTGLNHLTLTVRELGCRMNFLRQLRGFDLPASRDDGACLSPGGPAPGYTPYDFSIAQGNFDKFPEARTHAGMRFFD